jgi:hypothetical protein
MAKQRMKIKWGDLARALLAGVAIVALAAACGGSGTAAPTAGVSDALGGGPNGGFVPPGRGPNGGFAAGTVKSINGNVVTVTTNNNGDVQFQMSDSVAVQKVVEATVRDVVPGRFVTVTGQSNADGTIEASSLQVGDRPLRPDGGANGGFAPSGGGSNGGFAPPGGGSNGGFVAGTVKSTGNNTVTISTTNRGDVVVELPGTAVIRATVAGTASDIVVGQTVLAIGQTGANGAVVAASVQVGQLGQFGFGVPPGQ